VRILFVLEYYSPHIGGVEVLFKNLCEGLTIRGHDVTVVTSRLRGTKSFEVINGVKVHRVNVPCKGTRYWFTFLSIPKVFLLAKEADIIHTTTYNGALPAWIVSKVRGKECIITVHEILSSLWRDPARRVSLLSAKLHQFFEKLIISLPFKKYVCVSKYTYISLKLEGIDEKRLEVIYNGINNSLFDPHKSDGRQVRRRLNLRNEFIYMYYGRPGISKGVEYLVQAVPFISRMIPDSKLLLILANDPRDRYENIRKMIS